MTSRFDPNQTKGRSASYCGFSLHGNHETVSDAGLEICVIMVQYWDDFATPRSPFSTLDYDSTQEDGVLNLALIVPLSSTLVHLGPSWSTMVHLFFPVRLLWTTMDYYGLLSSVKRQESRVTVYGCQAYCRQHHVKHSPQNLKLGLWTMIHGKRSSCCRPHSKRTNTGAHPAVRVPSATQ